MKGNPRNPPAVRFGMPLCSALLLLTSIARTQEPSHPPSQETPPAESTAQAAAQERHARPRTDEHKNERLIMVQRQIEARGVRNAKVLDAMRNVPRHWFVPESLRSSAYADRALPIGQDQTISQPYIVALMTEALQLTPECKVLEIGTGSGYQAAVLAEMTPQVFTIEIVEPLARRAMETFKRHRYESIHVRIGDGYAGWPEHAPFDAIIVTCAPDHVPPQLVAQLKTGGRMCIPVGDFGAQELHILTKTESGEMQRQTLIPVRFVPMTGEAQKKQRTDAGED